MLFALKKGADSAKFAKDVIALFQEHLSDSGALVDGPFEDEEKNRKFTQVSRLFLQDSLSAGERLAAPRNYHELLSEKDGLITMSEAKELIPPVISNVLMAGVEPNLNLTRLIPSINVRPGTLEVIFPFIGSIDGVREVGEDEEYPDVNRTGRTGVMNVTLGKVGCKLSFTEEFVRLDKANGLGLMGWYLTQTGACFARFKERAIALFTLRNGIASFDNLGGRNCSGRGVTGAQNGVMTADDLALMYGEALADGQNLDTILIHPLAWMNWFFDPELAAYAYSGFQALPYNMPQGAPGLYGPSKANPTKVPWSVSDLQSSLHTVPQRTALPIRMIVTPFMRYVPATQAVPALTDIVYLDSNQWANLAQEESITTADFTDPMKDIECVKMKERYTILRAAEGRGVRVARNVPVRTTTGDPIRSINLRAIARYILGTSGMPPEGQPQIDAWGTGTLWGAN